MAVAYESVQTTAFATKTSGQTVVITKPTGLAVNDFLIAHLSQVVTSGSNANWDTPSGWTSLLNQNENTNNNSEARLTVFYKVADSGDVAASNFTFTTNTGACLAGGALYRVSGGASIAGTIDGIIDTTTPTFTNTLTPSLADSVMLFLVTAADAGDTTGSVSSYAITTNNPTWTERYDFTGSEGVANGTNRQGIMAGATASRPETTATGDSSCTLVNYSQNLVGAIVCITPPQNVNLSMPVGTLTVTGQEPSLTLGLVFPMPAGEISVTGNIPTLTTEQNNVWTEETKNSTTWTEETK